MATTQMPAYPPEYLAENKSGQLLGVAIAFGVLETVFFALFVVSRSMNKTANGLDFWIMPFAYITCFSHTIIISLFVEYGGAGRHVVAVLEEDPNQLVIYLKLLFSEEFIYLMSVLLPKLAILCLYLRVFTQKRYIYITYAVAVAMVLNWMTGCLMGLLMCRPIAFSWDKSIPGGSCGDIMGAFRWASLPNLVTDIAMLILPLPTIWSLHTGINQKVGLTLTFITGSIGIITSVVRFATFFTIDLFSDPTWYVVTSMTWTCVEPGVYFVAATMPSLRPLVRLCCKNVDFGTIYTRLVGASRGTFFSSRRDTTIPLSVVKETTIESSTGTSSRAGFSKLKDGSITVSEEDMEGLVDNYPSHQRRQPQSMRKTNGGAGYGWE